jgi:nitrous oxidase accessory protein NosD
MLMKNVLFLLFLAVSATFLLQSCKQDLDPALDESALFDNEVPEYFTPSKESFALSTNKNTWVTVPAGSVDVLNNVITAASPGDVILLAAGVHTENSTIYVTKSVSIVGADGAILKIHSPYSIPDANGNVTVTPAIRLFKAHNVNIQNIDFEPVNAESGVLVLVNNSHYFGFIDNTVSNFQMGVLLQKSQYPAIIGNTISVGATALASGYPAYGVVSMNGRSAFIKENEISGAKFGIWVGDRFGTVSYNNCSDNVVGINMSKVPVSIILPGLTAPVGSISSARLCMVHHNVCTNNDDNGIMIIDGANKNSLWANQASGNGVDPISGTATGIEVFGSSSILGYASAHAFGNSIDQTMFPSVTIRNCGASSTIVGGVVSNTGCR